MIEQQGHLKSIERNEIASALCTLYLQEIENDQELEDIPLLLKAYVACVFDNPAFKTGDGKSFEEQLDDARQRDASDLELETLARKNFESVRGNTAKRNLYIAHMARIAQLIELSGHLERENFFDLKRQERLEGKGIGIPGGIERIFCKVEDEIGGNLFTKADRKYIFRTPEEALKYLTIPVLEISLTQHPTNILTLDTLLLIRRMHDAAREICTSAESNCAHLVRHMREFSRNELTPVTLVDDKKKIRNFTADEELDFTLDTVAQIDANLASVYEPYEIALRNTFNKAYTDEMRWDFFLDLRLNSWTIGDKDGNRNIKAEHLLLATVRHRQTGIDLALRHMDEMDAAGIVLLPEWRRRLEKAGRRLEKLKRQLDAAHGPDGIDILLSQDDFDRIDKELAGALGPKDNSSDWIEFEKAYLSALKDMRRQVAADQMSALLSAYRSMKTFGLRGARIELRDTADVYKDVVYHLMGKPYQNFHDDKKAVYLDSCITSSPGYLKSLKDTFLATCKDAESLRAYNNIEALTYHTLKRLQVAASNPDLYRNSILAECKSDLHILENLTLQKMVQGSNGEEPALHIVPLFEEFEILKKISSIFEKTFHFRSYRDHCLDLAEGDFGQLRQKLQIAHSDNVRRSGTPAGRGNIHLTHVDVTAAMNAFKETLIGLYANDGRENACALSLFTEFFEGMSLSHVLRGGGRSLSAICNAFKIHRHTKFTAQGADLHNYLEFDTSIHRLLTRFFVHSAKEIALDENTFVYGSRPEIERAVSAACGDCIDAYKEYHFGDPEKGPQRAGMGWLLAHRIINYAVYSVTGNRGLRSASRRGNVEQKDFVDTINDTRAIGIAENMFDADVLGTWLGSERLQENLSGHLLYGDIYKVFFPQVNSVSSQTVVGPPREKRHEGRLLSAEELNGLYMTSPQFRDIIDQMACGLVASNVARLNQRLFHAQEGKNIIFNNHLRTYVQDVLPKDYIHASKLVLGAFGLTYDDAKFEGLCGQEPQADEDRLCNLYRQVSYMRHMIASAIPDYAEEYGVKSRFATASVLARDEILLDHGHDLKDEDLVAICDLLASRMITSHGRNFHGGEDIFYTSAKKHHLEKKSLG